MVGILDEGNVKLVSASESAANDKNIETIFPAADSRLRVIPTSKKKSNHMKSSALGGPEVDSEKTENSEFDTDFFWGGNLISSGFEDEERTRGAEVEGSGER